MIFQWIARRAFDPTQHLAKLYQKDKPLLGDVEWSENHSVMSNSLQQHGLHSPWNSPGQNTGVGIPSPMNRPDPEIKLESPALQADALPAELPGKPCS